MPEKKVAAFSCYERRGNIKGEQPESKVTPTTTLKSGSALACVGQISFYASGNH